MTWASVTIVAMQKPIYNPTLIEAKWQKIWRESHLFRAEIDPSKPKYYILDMFPYPSGAGLHVGHVTGYTGTDILARYYRQKGFNVLHPMGWDSFGLPAEQYAIRTGTHPALTTQTNIDTYRRQLQSLGLSYDWDREIATSDPSYYKWTQWIFTKLYEQGLAYEAEAFVNFCPALGTVLANEEVEEGRSKEGGYSVERRPLKQWILRITAYADRLLQDLDLLDWPEKIKKLQANWIGRSEGALIEFETEVASKSISVFTTRPDTLFGVTYVVLAPEHPDVECLMDPSCRIAVEEYRRNALMKSELERTELTKEKRGLWIGTYALHPVTKERLPIWIADYVLAGYGTGAVMGVPAHDERDADFAALYHLPVRSVYDEGGHIKDSQWGDFSLNGLSMNEAMSSMIAWLERHGSGRKEVHYKLRDWLFSRQRYWGEPIPVLHFEDGSQRVLGLDELPLTPPQLHDFRPSSTGQSPLAKVSSWVEVFDVKTGRRAWRETHTMPQWAGSCWYYLRFCDPTNAKEAWSQEAERYWMPVDLYVGGVEHAVLHLLYARFWHKVLYDLGLVHTSEPFLTLRNQGLVTARSYRLPKGGYLAETDVMEENGRFFAKQGGEELLVQTEKMSKSKLNGLTPDQVIAEFGADTLRLYEMFMGPFEKEKTWSSEAIHGCRRFLQRFFDMVTSHKCSDLPSEEALKLTSRLVHFVTKDIETMQFNTAIAHMMEFVNRCTQLPGYSRHCMKMAVQMLSPFAPHIAEELWEYLGEAQSISYVPLPVIHEMYLVDEVATYVVQVNGKLRARFEAAKDLDEEALMLLVQQQPEVTKYLEKGIVKTVFVPNKLLNLVVP